MHLLLIVTLVIVFPLDQVLQTVVTHLAVQYSLDLILSLLMRVGDGGGAGHWPVMGLGCTRDSLTMGKTGWRWQKWEGEQGSMHHG
jgi:hypothetical protein